MRKVTRWKEIILSNSPFISVNVAERFDSVRRTTFRLHGVPLSLYSLLLLLPLSLPPFPFFSRSHPKSRVTAIYSTSDPLYDCSRFTFMLDGLPKRLSDKAMNTLTGFSLLVFLRLAGQWCWYSVNSDTKSLSAYTMTCLPFCVASKAAKSASNLWLCLLTANTTQRGHRDVLGRIGIGIQNSNQCGKAWGVFPWCCRQVLAHWGKVGSLSVIWVRVWSRHIRCHKATLLWIAAI